MRNALLALLGLTFAGSFDTAFGWGCDGHQIVALLARVHLNPVSTNAVDQLLRQNPVDTASPYCKGSPGDLMADVASWADNVRNAEKNGPWHYIDIPLSVRAPGSDKALMQWCEPIGESVEGKDRAGCVINAIDYELAILRDTTKPGPERARALRYVIHFVGDMHQPLHTTDNNDHGGNCTSFHFFADERPSNLHSIWDSRLITKKMAETNETAPQFATELDSKYGEKWQKMAKGSVEDWAWEGHDVAEKVTYGDIVPRIPVEQPTGKGAEEPDCKAGTAKMAALDIKLEDRYYRKAIPVVEEQLARAGYRLAAILNRTLTK